MRTDFGAIFDVDGVLVDSKEAHYAAWCRLAEEVGKPHPRDFFERTFGMHNREIIRAWLGSGLPAEEVERLSAWKEAAYREAAAAALEPIDGAPDLVRALAADGFRLAVGSSGPPENIELALRALGLAGAFHAVSSGRDVSEGKPHPEVFLKAAAKLDLPPSRCVVFEDAPQGVEAGLLAGARAIAVASTRDTSDLRRAHLVVRSLRELDPARVRGLLAPAAAAKR